MDATMAMRRSLIDAALDALMNRAEKQTTRIRMGGKIFPAEDCEFPEETEQAFPEDAAPQWEQDNGYEPDPDWDE